MLPTTYTPASLVFRTKTTRWSGSSSAVCNNSLMESSRTSYKLSKIDNLHSEVSKQCAFQCPTGFFWCQFYKWIYMPEFSDNCYHQRTPFWNIVDKGFSKLKKQLISLLPPPPNCQHCAKCTLSSVSCTRHICTLLKWADIKCNVPREHQCQT